MTQITPTVDFDQEGKQVGWLRLPHSVTRSAYGTLAIPIAVIRNGAGPQILLISGTLNTMTFRQVIHSLDMAWNAVEEAMIFNFLSDRCGPGATPQVDPARRHGTSKLIDWALKRTWSVQFRQDYFPHGHDATIMMRKVS